MGSSAPNSRRHWPRHRGSYKPCPATLRRSVQCRLKGFLNTGGTSGPLFGMWFHEIAKAASTEPVEVSSLAAGVSNGLAPSSVSAKQGYNTMVDAIAPAADALTNAAAQQSNLGEALEAAAHAARVGAESTRSLIASRGRASYVGEVARGVLGPGAVSVALFFASAVVTNGGQGPDQAHLGRMEPREATALDYGLRRVPRVCMSPRNGRFWGNDQVDLVTRPVHSRTRSGVSLPHVGLAMTA